MGNPPGAAVEKENIPVTTQGEQAHLAGPSHHQHEVLAAIPNGASADVAGNNQAESGPSVSKKRTRNGPKRFEDNGIDDLNEMDLGEDDDDGQGLPPTKKKKGPGSKSKKASKEKVAKEPKARKSRAKKDAE